MTRYEFFRKRIAPVLFLGMVGFIAYDTCNKGERRHATIVIDLGAAESRVRRIDAELVVNNEVVGRFNRRAMPDQTIGCPCKFRATMPDEAGTLRFDIEVAPGDVRQLTRQIRPIEDSTVTVSLDSDLR